MPATPPLIALPSAPLPAIQGQTGIAVERPSQGTVQIVQKPKPGIARVVKSAGWQQILQQRLPLPGHRNWVCVVDSAYPWQNSPGIELVDTGSDHVTVLKAVLAALAKAP